MESNDEKSITCESNLLLIDRLRQSRMKYGALKIYKNICSKLEQAAGKLRDLFVVNLAISHL